MSNFYGPNPAVSPSFANAVETLENRRYVYPDIERNYGDEAFYSQSDAFDYLVQNDNDQGLRLFSYEFDRKNIGRRKFLVLNVETFWHGYKKEAPTKRHFYEIIMKEKPCRLYFDLEFDLTLNPDRDADYSVKYFINHVGEKLKEYFGLDVTEKNVLDLESSTPTKFSRHLIFHLPRDKLFRSNTEMGHFVKTLCDGHSPDDPHLPDHFDCLRFTKDEQHHSWLWDGAVYTKNRNFRLFLSSKLSKEYPLKLHPDCQFYASRKRNAEGVVLEEPISDKRVFFDSLITVVAAVLPSQLLASVGPAGEIPHSSTSRVVHRAPPKTHKASTYPLIDNFIRDHIRSYSDVGYIRCIHHFDNLLVYELVDWRYCHNIGREHKSNNIMLIVDLYKRQFYQKCHDPDCANFRSSPVEMAMELFRTQTLTDSDVELDAMMREGEEGGDFD